MRAPILLAVFVVTISVTYATEHNWEFGKDGGQDLIDFAVGEISPTEKFKEISLRVNRCSIVDRVSVMVDSNYYAIPKVYYAPEMKTVYIGYGEKELSKSIYVVIARGTKTLMGCDPNTWSPTTPYPPQLSPHPAVVPIPSVLPNYYGK